MQGCGEWLERRHISTHQTKQCTERPYSCQYCKDYNSTFKDVTEVHYTDCGDYPVNCHNNCQEEPLKRQELESHLENDCPLVTIDCPFKYAACDANNPRKDMPEDTATICYTQLVKENSSAVERKGRQTNKVFRLSKSLPCETN